MSYELNVCAGPRRIFGRTDKDGQGPGRDDTPLVQGSWRQVDNFYGSLVRGGEAGGGESRCLLPECQEVSRTTVTELSRASLVLSGRRCQVAATEGFEPFPVLPSSTIEPYKHPLGSILGTKGSEGL